jgi:Ca2+-dependent lipid-binding protein
VRWTPSAPDGPAHSALLCCLGGGGASPRLSQTGTLRIHLVGATGLRASDRIGGVCDAYASVELGPRPPWRTAVVPKTLSPSWDATYVVDDGSSLGELLGASPMTVHVRDANFASRNDALGAS